MAPGFEDLELNRAAGALRMRINRPVRQLPDEQRYNLASEMRRAAPSLTNSSADGHGSRSFRHKVSYLYRSCESANEPIDDLNACEDGQYFQPEHLHDLRQDIDRGYHAYEWIHPLSRQLPA